MHDIHIIALKPIQEVGGVQSYIHQKTK